jgi:hypothetical protein
MGGYGSGNHSGSRGTVERALHVPIGWMIRQVPLCEGTWTRSLQWTCLGQVTGSTGYKVTRDSEKPIGIKIICNRNEAPFSQDIDLCYQHMPRGGFKTFALCPYCRSKRLNLYFSRRELLCCRKCADLTFHSSQSSSKPSGDFGLLTTLLQMEKRDERAYESQENARNRCREWRRRSKVDQAVSD